MPGERRLYDRQAEQSAHVAEHQRLLRKDLLSLPSRRRHMITDAMDANGRSEVLNNADIHHAMPPPLVTVSPTPTVRRRASNSSTSNDTRIATAYPYRIPRKLHDITTMERRTKSSKESLQTRPYYCKPALFVLTTCGIGCRMPLLSPRPRAVPFDQPIFIMRAWPLFSAPSSGASAPTISPSL
jgi:hypothetical protein